MTYHYAGTDSRGVGRTGTTDENPAAFADRAYRNGWRSMRMITNDDEARPVAEVGRDDEGRRLWWGEGDDTQAEPCLVCGEPFTPDGNPCCTDCRVASS